MPEAPEIPEAKDPFEKRAAVTVAIIAVILAVIGNRSESAKTEAIIKTNEASNKWAYFQAKGIKGSIASAQQDLLISLSPSQKAAEGIEKNAEHLKGEAERYKTEQEGIKEDAEKLEKGAASELKIAERCEKALLALQIAIVLASISILARSHCFWIASVIVGLIGLGVGLTALTL